MVHQKNGTFCQVLLLETDWNLDFQQFPYGFKTSKLLNLFLRQMLNGAPGTITNKEEKNK